MSFQFNAEAFKDNSFNETIKEKLTKALNSSSTSSSSSSSSIMRPAEGEHGIAQECISRTDTAGIPGATKTTTTTTSSTLSTAESTSMMKSRKLDILKSGITVSKVNFPTMPELEILDLDISAQPRSLVKGICKISCKNAMLQIQTEIESNLLLVYSDYSPDFTTPTMNCKDSFTIPITMVFNDIHLEAITNIFVKNSGIGISFNDVNLDFKFDCSIKILQSTIEKRLKKSMQLLFKEVLPSVIFNMSQSLFTSDQSTKNLETDNHQEISNDQSQVLSPKVILDESDLQELSPANMLRLSTLISSRQTLSLHATVLNVPSTIPGCLERQNLHRFNSRIPSLTNYYAAYKNVQEQTNFMKRTTSSSLVPSHNCSTSNQNVLPEKVLKENAYDLKAITNIQVRIFERSTDENVRPRRRKIKLARNRNKIRQEKVQEKIQEQQPSKESKTTQTDDDNSSMLTVDSSETVVTSPRPTSAMNSVSLIHDPEEDISKKSRPNLSPNAVSSLNLPVSITSKYFTQPEKSLLHFENHHEPINGGNQQMGTPLGDSSQKLNLLEETNYFSHKPELQKLRSSLYSPIARGGTIFNPNKELGEPREPRQLLENRNLSFVGLNHRGWKWGNEDEPPPYHS